MKSFKSQSLKSYLNCLSAKEPVPGGGSASALAGALGVGLIGMVANYSLGKSSDQRVERKLQNILKQSTVIGERLLELVDLDAEAYLAVVAARKGSVAQKIKADRYARKIPQEICKLVFKAIDLTPFLVAKGNKYLISDIEAAVEILAGAFKAALTFTKDNS